MKRKLAIAVLLCGTILLTGCKITVTTPKGTKEYNSLEEAMDDLKGDSKKVEEAVGEIIEDLPDDIIEDADSSDEGGEVPKSAWRDVAPPADYGFEDDWSESKISARILEFYDKLHAFNTKTAGMDAVLLTDYSLDAPKATVTIDECLDTFMLIKYSKEWDIDYDESKSLVKWKDLDDLAAMFGFTSSDAASEIYDSVMERVKGDERVPAAHIHNTYGYTSSYSPVLEKYDFDGVDHTETIFADAGGDLTSVLSRDENGRTMLSIPLIGDSIVEYKGKNYWILVPNAYDSLYTDVHFDTHCDVKLYADWSQLIGEAGDGVTWASDLKGYKFKKDHGIAIIPETYVATMTEEDLQKLTDDIIKYESTDYSEELILKPTVEKLSEVDMPYDLYESYFGLTGMSEGANLQRLAGDYSYWDSHAIGGGDLAE